MILLDPCPDRGRWGDTGLETQHGGRNDGSDELARQRHTFELCSPGKDLTETWKEIKITNY